jgi:uncharacterized protein YdaU (DUF1376 family)
MHYYQHHIGDFMRDTSNLTNDQLAVYMKMLWLYYDTEKPLPNNLFQLGMKTGSRDDQVNLEGLLGMFFVLDMENQCWHHTRCDKEIAHYKLPTNKNFKDGAKKLKQPYYYKWEGIQDVLQTMKNLYNQQQTTFKFNISFAYLLVSTVGNEYKYMSAQYNNRLFIRFLNFLNFFN